MDVIAIKGGIPLSGKIAISGSKNACLPIIASSLMTEETLVISNIPHLADVITMNNLLLNHGCDITIDSSSNQKFKSGKTILINAANVNNLTAPYEIVKKMRASVLVLGPLLTRFGRASVSLPGGCAIGSRPINFHLDALAKMGAEIELVDGYVNARAPKGLTGANIHFDQISVTATENVMMAATLAKGETTIINAAREPEIVDLAKCLKTMGAKIEGEGSATIKINGVEKLKGGHHIVIPDRIEAGTYAVAAAITQGKMTLTGITKNDLIGFVDKLVNCGIKIFDSADGLIVSNENGRITASDISTMPYPGFSTDMQAQFMALMCIAQGSSVITENIFENRFMHVAELNRMGAKIALSGKTATIRNIEHFKAAEVMATDLRASVALVLAGLAAKGETKISRVYHIDRGYEHIEEKLKICGAQIRRITKY